MRTVLVATGICLGIVGLVAAGDASASMRVSTRIPAQPLSEALKTLATERNFQVLYLATEIGAARTAGAFGELTQAEALNALLSGTGFTYKYLDDNTVTVMAAVSPQPQVRALAAERPTAPASPATKEPQKSSGFWDRFRVARMDSPVAASDGQVDDKAAASEPARLEEVVVTAQKREERLQNVPISISVMRGEDLDRSTGSGIQDALRSVPGVAPAVNVFGGSSNVSVRGAAAGGPVFFGSSPVAYYVDSVPFGLVKSAIAPDAAAYDLERVEVLRGPQGTLYGASAQNGVVRVLTKDADLSAFSWKARVAGSGTQYGGENYRADMAINVPLIADKLAARASLGYDKQSGWIDRPTREDANDARLLNLRLKVNAQPTEALSVGLSTWVSRNDYGAPNYSPDNRRIAFNDNEAIDNDFDVHGLKLGYDFGAVSFTSATSYIDYTNHFFFVVSPVLNLETRLTSRVFSQEFYLASTGSGPWRWTAGASYRDGKDSTLQVLGGATVLTDTEDKSESAAAFGELTRALLDGRVELTGGLRYFRDKVTGIEPDYLRSSTFNKVSPRAVLTWHANESLTSYVSYSEGFRSGFNQAKTAATIAPNFPPVEADNLKNYELGAKGGLWDGRLSFDTAVYFMKWQGVQQLITVPLNPALNLNAPAAINGVSASGVGVDVSLTARPTRALTLGVNFSWNDLTQDEDVVAFPTGAPNGVVVFPKDTRLNLSPKSTAGASVEYAFPFANGYEARLAASANYVASQFYKRLVGTAVDVTPGEDLVIGRVSATVDFPARWSTTLYVDNVNNEQNWVFQHWAGSVGRDLHVRPRTIGLQAEYHY